MPTSNNKRIAKNTLIMYVRMLLVMVITLITVRFVLKALGIEDYGIYNVVAGLVTAMSFVSMSMQMATQRFYAYALGEKNDNHSKLYFNLSLLIYAILVIVVIILAETVGLWFLYNKMVIPESRFVAALWIYHFALLSFVVTMLATPFSAMIIAHEDMGVYALISLIDCILKFAIVLPLLFISGDKLIIYGILVLCVTVIKEGINISYSKKHYAECSIKRIWDKTQFKSILSYSGWSLFGTTAYIAYSQGNNLLLNLFFGPVANAAQAIAFQVSNAMNMFASNFFAVVRPPIIKNYAEGNHTYMMKIFYMSSKFTYCMLFIIFLPLIVDTEFILNLWLDEVNEYMIAFTRLTLIATLILSMHNPITTIIQASGAVKKYYLIVEFFTLFSVPLTYLFFKTGYSAEYTFYTSIGLFVLAHCVRVWVLKTIITFSVKEYFYKFILPVLVISIISISVVFYVHLHLPYGIKNFILTTLISVLLVSVISYFLAFSKQEKLQITKMINSKR